MIGIIDSGAGGLSVWKEMIKLLPTESYFYISDAAHCPYGPKSKQYVTERVKKLSSFLIEKGAEIIVVACNTATAAAIDELRASFAIPFIGMEPAVKPAAIQTKTGVVGVLATEGTLHGKLYLSTSEKYARAREVQIIERVGEGLVELVEQGLIETPEAEQLVKRYTDPMLKAGADCVVLGCTHYPFLAEVINKVTEGRLQIINPAPAVARHAAQVLKESRKNRLKSSNPAPSAGQPLRSSPNACNSNAYNADACDSGACPQNTCPSGTYNTDACDSNTCLSHTCSPGACNIIATTGSSTTVLKQLAERILASLAAEGKLTDEQIVRLKGEKFIHLNI